MLKLFLLSTLAMTTLISCAHYHTVQLGEGEPSNKQVESCTYYVAGFPVNRHNSRLDRALLKNSLKRKDVYSVERYIWPYLPIVIPYCLVFSLNEKAAKSYKGGEYIVEPVPGAQTSPNSVQPIHVNRDQVDPNYNWEEDPDFLKINSMKDCDQFTGLYRSNCKRAVYDRIRKLKKSAK